MDTAYAALIGWIPVAVVLFAILRPSRALVVACLVGWLVLPRATLMFHGFWNIDKVVATNAGILLGALMFAPHKFAGYKFTLADAALLAFAGGTCITSIVNGLGVYDGISSCGQVIVRYGVPFFLGRAFIRTREDLYDAARIAVLASAAYALLAVWEWRMSPTFHRMLYGYFQAAFSQHLRWGFHRPIVFFPHALSLATFFVWTSLLAIALWKTGRIRPIAGLNTTSYVFLPIVGLAASMSLGPYGLFLGGVALLLAWHHRRWHWVLLMPVIFATLWMGGRYSGYTSGEWLASPVNHLSEDRAGSLQYRVDAETVLIERAKERPIFGWGTWGRNRVTDERGRDAVVTDGLWVILLGSYGLFGLTAFYVYWCWPLGMCLRARATPAMDPVLVALLAGIALQAVNFLFNGFLGPPLSLLHGGAVTLLATARCAAPSPAFVNVRRIGHRIHPARTVPAQTARTARW